MIDRRGFLKFIGGGALGMLATPVIWKGLDDISIWSQNWSWIPSLEYGDNTYVKTVSKLCPSAVGTKVRLVGGRPVRVLGDEEHPLSLGGISSLAATEVQMRYSPSRIKVPYKKNKDGTYTEISWDEAEGAVKDALRAVQGTNKTVCLSGDENGSINEMLSSFIRKLGSDRFFIMPGEGQATAAAWDLMGGEGRVGYDVENSDCVVAIGANVLESWGPVIRNRCLWGKAQSSDTAHAMKLIYAGSVQNNTASASDIWLPIRPGTELIVLMGIVHELIASDYRSLGQDFKDFYKLTKEWNSKKVVSVTGIPSTRFNEALDMVRHAKAPVVIVGSSMGSGISPSTIIAGMAVNALLNRINKKGGVYAVELAPQVIPEAFSYREMMLNDFVGHIEKVGGEGHVCIFYEANPVYALPNNAKVEKFIDSASCSISFSSFFDETAKKCDLILPLALGLERFDDVVYPHGYPHSMYTISKPIVPPLHQARPVGDVLLSVAGGLEIPMEVKTTKEFFQAKAKAVGANWAELMEGKAFVQQKFVNVSLRYRPEVIQATLTNMEYSKQQLAVGFVHKLSLGTPNTAIPPFATKIITEDELQQNILVARVNRITANKYNLHEGLKIWIQNDSGKVEAVVSIFEGVAYDTVALTMGFGHTAFDEFSLGKGANVMKLVGAHIEPGVNVSVWPVVTVDIVGV